MEKLGISVDRSSDFVIDSRIEEDVEDFRSCYSDEEEVWRETDDLNNTIDETNEELKEGLDEFSAKLLFKGVCVSISGTDDSCSGFSGIGVSMKRSSDFPEIQIQKRLEFYVEESVADYLALLDGLAAATQHEIRRVHAFTDSRTLYDQIVREEKLDFPLMFALRQRVLEETRKLETFVLKLVPSHDLKQPLHLAQVSAGIVSSLSNGNNPFENCLICCEDRPSEMTITTKCSHKFCSQCMKKHVEEKVQLLQVPIPCPDPDCKCYVSISECKSFLPIASFESLEKAFEDVTARKSARIYCPYPNCVALLDPFEGLSSSSCCVECPVCERAVCVECGVPWHSSVSCEDFWNLPEEAIEASDSRGNQLWRRCLQCRRMVELSQGCCRMTCRNGNRTWERAFRNEEERIDGSEDPFDYSVSESEQSAWETLNSLPMITDGDPYSDQELSQLAIIQRFLAIDDPPYQPPPPRCTTESYFEAAMKDLHQLPWLERFVSVISDDYYEEYIQ